jgi:hypothetical protein
MRTRASKLITQANVSSSSSSSSIDINSGSSLSHKTANLVNSKKIHLGELAGELETIFQDMQVRIDKRLVEELLPLFDKVKDMIENRDGISLNGADFTLCESRYGAFMISTYLISLLNAFQKATMKKLSFVEWPIEIEQWSLYTITATFKNLHYLKLHDCKMGPDNCKTLAESLEHNKSIIELDLSYNRLIGIHTIRSDVKGGVDISGLRSLFAAILSADHLQILDISGNYLGGIRCSTESSDNHMVKNIDNCGEHVAYMIGSLLRDTKSLKSLNLNANEFDDNEKIQKMLLTSMESQNNCYNSAQRDANNVLCDRRSGSPNTDCNEDTNYYIYNNTNDDINTHKLNDSSIQLETSSSPSSFSSSFRPFSKKPVPNNLFPVSLQSPSCKTLCGITIVNSKNDGFMHDNFRNSNFNPQMGDSVDMSNLSLEPLTGRLLGKINTIYYKFICINMLIHLKKHI